MKNSVYYCRLSGGNVYRVEFATSAGEAIHQALFANRNNTVTDCWQGPEYQDPRYPKGQIHYSVPPHQAIPHDAVKPANRRPKDNTETFGFLADIPSTK